MFSEIGRNLIGFGDDQRTTVDSFENETKEIFENQWCYFVWNEITLGSLWGIVIDLRRMNDGQLFAVTAFRRFHLESLQIARRFIFCIRCHGDRACNTCRHFDCFWPCVQTIKSGDAIESRIEETDCKKILPINKPMNGWECGTYPNRAFWMNCCWRTRDTIFRIESRIWRYDNFGGTYDTFCWKVEPQNCFNAFSLILQLTRVCASVPYSANDVQRYVFSIQLGTTEDNRQFDQFVWQMKEKCLPNVQNVGFELQFCADQVNGERFADFRIRFLGSKIGG